VAAEAAAPLDIPVFPVVNYGLTPYFRAYPGTISLRVATYLALIRDILEGLMAQGFRRILVVNGHGGNAPAQTLCEEWAADCAAANMRVKWHNWWNAPQTWAKVQAIDPVASHASWMENFPWTRLAGVVQPTGQKPSVDVARSRHLPPRALRALLGDGNFAGLYQRPDEDMLALWQTGVEETRARLTEPWD
jgi:creatinine amidohydrolase